MSKAVLILDEMPKCCENCRMSFLQETHIETKCFLKREKQIWRTVDPEANRPDWCPLREIKDVPDIVTGDDFGFAEGYTNGWRDCLKEIEGAE